MHTRTQKWNQKPDPMINIFSDKKNEKAQHAQISAEQIIRFLPPIYEILKWLGSSLFSSRFQ